MRFRYPLRLSFRLIALAPRISISDIQHNEILYIEQKIFALREAVTVFNNSREKRPLFMIKANQMLDFGARYYIMSADGKKHLGSVQQEGMRSLFRASYTIFDASDQALFKVSQQRPWAALLDSILSMIPFVEFITGYILNPTYEVKDSQQQPILLMKKNPSFFESHFTISDATVELTDTEELLILLSLIMVVQLERGRG